jgi:L-2-amino-thiazoline-4-carboxylic acid hydrolase
MGNDLSQVPILVRREIEARILTPVMEAFLQEVGEHRALEILDKAILSLARENGVQLASALGGNSLSHLASSMALWIKGGALEMDVLEQTPKNYDFNVTRCRYTELYRELGILNWGFHLSCNRDFAFVEGFNPDIVLTRTQTIMEGGNYCDFRYRLKKS